MCKSLISVTIPNSVSKISDGMFQWCSSLESVTIPSSIIEIGSSAFSSCSSLTSMTIPNSVTSLGGSAFYGCSALTDVSLGSSITSIGERVFRECTSLSNVVIPNSVTEIGDYVFQNCTSLTSVTLGNSVTTLGTGAFYSCSALTDISIPDAVTTIGDRAFYYCSNLVSMRLPEAVTEIGSYAFYGCSRLDTLYSYSPIPPSVASTSAFSYYHYNTLNVFVPQESLESYQNAYAWKDFQNLQGFVIINDENFPDDNFRNYLLVQDYGTDEMLTSREMEAVKVMDISEQDISSVEGLRYFTALTSLSCYGNQIKDESMDALISSLPLNMSGEDYPLYVYREGDGNVCTMAQVAAAQEKGWTPYYYDGGSDSWLEYAGSDAKPDDDEEMPDDDGDDPDDGNDDNTDGIDAVHVNKDGKDVIYTINGVKVSTTNVSDLPAGIYIVNGKKVVVK